MKNSLSLFFLLFCLSVYSQNYVLDSIKPTLGHLINFNANTFKLASNSPTFNRFFTKLDSVYNGKKTKLHIFHIGGSHIQADIYSNKIRTYLQNMNDVSIAQRGFVFPYHLAHTNNPTNYRIEAKNNLWTGYRCSVKKDSIAWGLSGITAAFRSVADTIYIKSNYKNYTKKRYDFDGLRVFYNTYKEDYTLSILGNNLVLSDTLNKENMYKEFRFNKVVDSVAIQIKLKDTTVKNPEFALMGIEYLNKNPGIEYTSIGVNGASFAYYDRSAFFETQLKTYKPDLFIISIGTNDANVPKAEFDSEKYRSYYEAFILMVQRLNPNCAILLTVPNDDYYKRKFPNPNTVTQQKIIMEIAKKFNMAVWDVFEIMGGLGASNKWYKNKLMQRDRIHFTHLGYSIKADLFIDALISAWAESKSKNKKELLTFFKKINE